MKILMFSMLCLENKNMFLNTCVLCFAILYGPVSKIDLLYLNYSLNMISSCTYTCIKKHNKQEISRNINAPLVQNSKGLYRCGGVVVEC